MKKLILTIQLLASFATFAQPAATTVDIGFPLALREKFYTTYLEVQRDMNDILKTEALSAWEEIKIKESKNFRRDVLISLNKHIQSEKIMTWFAHYQLTGQHEKAAQLLGSYYYMVAAFIWETGTNPRLTVEENKDKAVAQAATQNAFAAAAAIDKCLPAASKQAGTGIRALADVVNVCVGQNSAAMKMLSDAIDIMNARGYTGANQVLSLAGNIPGNQVEQLLENHYDADYIRYIAPMTAKVRELYADKKIEDFQKLMTNKKTALTDIFTVTEGFPARPGDHKNWSLMKANGKKNIYGQVFNAISNAKETIFIDVFFIGGSIGVTLAKHIIEQVQAKPNLSVFILNDRKNTLGYNYELAPAYNYLKAYAEKFPEDRIFLSYPRVDLKRTAFPSFAESLLTDSSLRKVLSPDSMQALSSRLGFYPKGKSDHSKVFVIDGLNQDTGVAFVGSKNYTDSSGGVAYDEVTQIKGPAVPMVLDSYYYDLYESVKEELLAKKQDASHAKIQQILKPVDVLKRYENSGKALAISWKVQGSTTMRLGENNVYGTVRTALPQDIHAIQMAEKQIIINEQYLYDPSVVRALIDAVNKRVDLKVYVLLNPQDDYMTPQKSFAHVPNISYSELLNQNPRIKVRWKKIPAEHLAALKEVNAKYGVSLAPEFHLKTISVDGVSREQASMCSNVAANSAALQSQMKKLPLLISGSANKDVMTMTGGFREYQVTVYDRSVVMNHDCQFWNRYLSDVESADIKFDTMNIPPELKAKGIGEKEFNQILRDLIGGFYSTTTGYFTK